VNAEPAWIDDAAHIDPTASIGPGSVLQGEIVVEGGARVGPLAVLSAPPGGRLLVGRESVVGARATVEGAVTIGPYAQVEAGTVLLTDVPARAIVGGTPPRITGYVGTAAASRGTSALGDLGAVHGARLVALPDIRDVRGALSFAEVGAQLPFTPRRVFVQYDVPSREARGEHAHRELHQFLLCVHGSVKTLVDDGRNRAEVVLDRPSLGLHVPPMVWGGQFAYEPDSVLVVLASASYDPADYIRDYGEFEALVRG
jgi:UDP-2-acetamido-3-amino-2,3-dideoxy-glucuronate N-acetyltransferase